MKRTKKSSSGIQPVNFNRNFLDPTTPISRLGTGEIGGKAEGLAFIRHIIHSKLNQEEFPDIKIEIPSMTIVCTDIFDSFMKQNQLYDIAYSDLPDDRIAHSFQKADLPFECLVICAL
jgi:hypothetical protein